MAVFLPAGTYLTTKPIVINRSGITLMGDGPEQTGIKLIRANTSVQAPYIIGIISTSGAHNIYVKDVTGGLSKGSSSITLSDTTGIEPGTIWLIDQLNDGDIVSNIGAGGEAEYVSREEGQRAMGQMIKITQVNGNKISFEPSLYLDYNIDLSPQIWNFKRNAIFNSGVQDLSVESLINENDVNSAKNNILMEVGAYNWIKNIESIHADLDHVSILGSSPI